MRGPTRRSRGSAAHRVAARRIGDDHSHLTTNQLCRHRRHPVVRGRSSPCSPGRSSGRHNSLSLEFVVLVPKRETRLPPTPRDAAPPGRSRPFFSTRTCGYNCSRLINRERINDVKALRLLLCLAVAACAELGTRPWVRVDGNPASPEQLDLDKTTCRQEMERSVRETTQALRSDVYETCMGRLGYTDKKNQRFTAPAAVQVGAAPPAAQVGAAPAASRV
jgi:hypothetical protein